MNEISYQKYVGEELLNLENRLKSKNVRKTLAGVRYSLNYYFVPDGIKVYYREEEPGCDVYYTNDTTGCYFPETYFLDSYDEQRYFETIEEAAESVSEIVGCTVEATIDAIQEALEKYVEQKENSGEEAFCCFHEFNLFFIALQNGSFLISPQAVPRPALGESPRLP